MEEQVRTEPLEEEKTTWRLSELKPGRIAVIDHLAIDGEERRRLMDLGMVPGTRVTAEFRSALGDPVAFRIRGSLIALRKVQTRQIVIKLVEE
ncbi:MAG: ferrous iron transport protein A [Anaerolineae bacterium]|nr:ferrous iron transport protein A [Anaerolineae bacterium]